MSADTVDDLHNVEDLAESLAEAVEKLLYQVQTSNVISADELAAASSFAETLLERWRTYCRPTCGWRYEGECREDETCGCPCEHVPVGETS